MIYGDSSFLIALYRVGDVFHLTAAKLAARLKQPIIFTLLCELELHNGVRRCLGDKLIDQREHDAIFRQIPHDEAEGILIRRLIQDMELYTRARDLSKKFTPELFSRSLDILHVASAQIVGASTFISFDTKQRRLAQKTRLNVLPRTLNRA
jgi:predicted nucleic acid-binding protein